MLASRILLLFAFSVGAHGIRKHQTRRAPSASRISSEATWQNLEDVYIKTRRKTTNFLQGTFLSTSSITNMGEMAQREQSNGRQRWDFQLLTSKPYNLTDDHAGGQTSVGVYYIVRHGEGIQTKYLCTGHALGSLQVVGLWKSDGGTGKCQWFIQKYSGDKLGDSNSYWLRNAHWEVDENSPKYLGLTSTGLLGTTSKKSCETGDGLNCVWYLMSRDIPVTPDAEKAGTPLMFATPKIAVEGEWEWLEQVVTATTKKVTTGTEIATNETHIEKLTAAIQVKAGFSGIGINTQLRRELESSFSKYFKQSIQTTTEIHISMDQVRTRPQLWQWVYYIKSGNQRMGETRTTSFWFTSTKSKLPRCYPGHCVDSLFDKDCQKCETGFEIE